MSLESNTSGEEKEDRCREKARDVIGTWRNMVEKERERRGKISPYLNPRESL